MSGNNYNVGTISADLRLNTKATSVNINAMLNRSLGDRQGKIFGRAFAQSLHTELATVLGTDGKGGGGLANLLSGYAVGKSGSTSMRAVGKTVGAEIKSRGGDIASAFMQHAVLTGLKGEELKKSFFESPEAKKIKEELKQASVNSIKSQENNTKSLNQSNMLTRMSLNQGASLIAATFGLTSAIGTVTERLREDVSLAETMAKLKLSTGFSERGAIKFGYLSQMAGIDSTRVVGMVNKLNEGRAQQSQSRDLVKYLQLKEDKNGYITSTNEEIWMKMIDRLANDPGGLNKLLKYGQQETGGSKFFDVDQIAGINAIGTVAPLMAKKGILDITSSMSNSDITKSFQSFERSIGEGLNFRRTEFLDKLKEINAGGSDVFYGTARVTEMVVHNLTMGTSKLYHPTKMTSQEKGNALMGAAIGGAVGSALGPLGTLVGTSVGTFIGAGFDKE